MIKTITSIAGKQRWIITIPGLIIIWFVAAILMPKTCNKKDKIKTVGVWYNKHDSGFIRMEIKESGYFYYDVVPTNGKSKQYKGVIDTEKEKGDTILLKSFSGDTLLFGKIKIIDKHTLIISSKNDTTDIKFSDK
ncbi:MAG: hypothetical protein KA319_01165 [Ferruginibacter sp.]|nr:hypothetical protein [Ferruginibacter sp.]